MAKKKLLSESQIRRFMGLAGIRALSENKMEEELTEAGTYMEDESELDDESDVEDADAPAEPPAEMPAADEVSVDKETIDKAGDALTDLLGQLGYEDKAGAPDEMGGEPVDDITGAADLKGPEIEDVKDDEDVDDEEIIDEALKGVNVELSENEIVQEVARRVAKRILKAKSAQSKLNEALGNKPIRRASRQNRRRKK
jgi:hypothetical protein